MEEIVESESIPSNTGKMVWSIIVLLRVVRDMPRRERPLNVKSDIPGSRLNILERAKGDENGGDGFATAKLPDTTRKLSVLENFVKMEMRFVLNIFELSRKLIFNVLGCRHMSAFREG